MATKTIPKTSDRKTQKEATASQPASGGGRCGMKKAMISVGLIEQLGDLELPLIGLTELAEKSEQFDSVTVVLRPILNELQNIILRIQCEAQESTDLRSIPGGVQ